VAALAGDPRTEAAGIAGAILATSINLAEAGKLLARTFLDTFGLAAIQAAPDAFLGPVLDAEPAFTAKGTINPAYRARLDTILDDTTDAPKWRKDYPLGPFLATLMAAIPKTKTVPFAACLRERGYPPRIAAVLSAPDAVTPRNLFDAALRIGLEPTDAFQFFLEPPHRGPAKEDGWADAHWRDQPSELVMRQAFVGKASFDLTFMDLQGQKIRLPETFISNWSLTLDPEDFDFSGVRQLITNSLHLRLRPGTTTAIPCDLIVHDLVVAPKDHKAKNPSGLAGTLTLNGRVRVKELGVSQAVTLTVTDPESERWLAATHPPSHLASNYYRNLGILHQWRPERP
jgi:hypothetical protein